MRWGSGKTAGRQHAPKSPRFSRGEELGVGIFVFSIPYGSQKGKEFDYLILGMSKV
jgi:hypothetical protein